MKNKSKKKCIFPICNKKREKEKFPIISNTVYIYIYNIYMLQYFTQK